MIKSDSWSFWCGYFSEAGKFDWIPCEFDSRFLRVVQTQAILFFKSMSEGNGSDNITTMNLIIQSIFSRSRNSSFNFRVVVCRIRYLPTLLSSDPLSSDIDLKTKRLKVWATLKILNGVGFANIRRPFRVKIGRKSVFGENW